MHRVVKYLVGTKDKGLHFKPNKDLGIVCHVDADFAGCWSKIDSENPASVLSRTGYVIQYCGCPLIWDLKLQTETALSTCKSEYIALLQTVRELIPLIGLLSEIAPKFGVAACPPKVKCTLFGDNDGCLQLARAPRMNPRTKYISLKYHHCISYVQNKIIEISPIDTSDQIADMLTKPLETPQFEKLRGALCRW